MGESPINLLHPTGIEPASEASEATVLSIRLRVHMPFFSPARGKS